MALVKVLHATHNSQLTPRKLGLAILLALGSALSQASLAADSLTGLGPSWQFFSQRGQ